MKRALPWLILLGSLAIGQLLAAAPSSFTGDDLARARELHRRHLVLDCHADTPLRFMDPAWNIGDRHATGHLDIPRLREGGVDAQFLAVYMGRTPGNGVAIKRAVTILDAIHETVRHHSGELELARTAAGTRAAWRHGRIACLIGIEGGHIIESSLPALRTFHRLGVRYLTLTHSFNTAWADSAGTFHDVEGVHGGLSPFGKTVVREMNRLGMMVDVSHVADSTFRDALETSTAPIIASHSSARAVYDHRRNLSDEMLLALARHGGVVMVNFYSGYIDPGFPHREAIWEAKHRDVLDRLAERHGDKTDAYWEAYRAFKREHPIPPTPLVVLARHIEHIAGRIGWDHIGMGADWDGMSDLPAGLDHCGDLPKLTALLLARGAREDDLRGYLGENLLRTMEACERRAVELER